MSFLLLDHATFVLTQGLGGWLSLMECSLPVPPRPAFSSSDLSSNPTSLGRTPLTTGLKVTPSHSLPHDPILIPCLYLPVWYSSGYFIHNSLNLECKCHGSWDTVCLLLYIHTSTSVWHMTKLHKCLLNGEYLLTLWQLTVIIAVAGFSICWAMYYVPSTVRCVNHLTYPISSTLAQWPTLQVRVSYPFYR